MEGSRVVRVARHSRYAVCRRWRPGSRARCAPLGGRGLWGQEDGVLCRTIRHRINRSGMLVSCSVLYRATFSRHLFGQSLKVNSANFAITEFSEVRVYLSASLSLGYPGTDLHKGRL